MTTDSARKNQIREYMREHGVSYAEAVRQIGTPVSIWDQIGPDRAGDILSAPCWTVSLGPRPADVIEQHFTTRDEATTWRADYLSTHAVTDLLYEPVARLEDPCALVICGTCGEHAPNDLGGDMHCTSVVELAENARWCGYVLVGGRLRCEECLTYPSLTVGQRIRFEGEKAPYRVRVVSRSRRFAIVTKPFNLKKTVLYSVIDFALGVRGTDNAYNRHGYTTEEHIARSMQAFEAGEIEVSHRHWEWLRYADEQPDTVTSQMLHELRTTTWHSFATEPERYNGIHRTNPEPPPETSPDMYGLLKMLEVLDPAKAPVRVRTETQRTREAASARQRAHRR